LKGRIIGILRRAGGDECQWEQNCQKGSSCWEKRSNQKTNPEGERS
jgi:hypothetical protein